MFYRMLALGIQNPIDFDFMDSPDVETVAIAMQLLLLLGAVDDQLALTQVIYIFHFSKQFIVCFPKKNISMVKRCQNFHLIHD